MPTSFSPPTIRRAASRRSVTLESTDSRELDDHSGSPQSMRSVRARAGLPSGRAVLGAGLITLAVLGIVAAYRTATNVEYPQVLVINQAVEPGATIGAADLALAPMDLVEITADRAFSDPDDVIGRTALVALQPGDLVVDSVMAQGELSAALASRTVGLSLDSHHALGGRLHRGDRVDVVASAGPSTEAGVLVRDAIVSSVSTGSSSAIGSAGRISLTLDVTSEADVLAIVAADGTDGVTLVRATEP